MIHTDQDILAAKEEALDVDARFLLANERTFLAWVRTTLAVMIGGIALTQLGNESTTQSIVGMMVIMLGGFMSLVGYMRFKTTDRAIRAGNLPETGREPFIQATGIIFVSLILVATHLLNIW
jgi:putative membrane protein